MVEVYVIEARVEVVAMGKAVVVKVMVKVTWWRWWSCWR
jgi:hypothetical protein